jgi:hypothetical protein
MRNGGKIVDKKEIFMYNKCMDINGKADELLDNVLPIFRKYSEEYRVEDIHDFKIKRKIYDKNDLFSKEEQTALDKTENNFSKNILIKEIVSNKLNKLKSKDNVLEYYNWIVRDWGEITRFNKSIATIDEFFNQLDSEKIKSEFYNTISSLSKIAFFTFPQKYFIYDSRVAYVLDWILIQSKRETLFFYVPEGRNSFLKKYNMDGIISSTNGKYLNKSYTYFIYNKLIEKIFVNIKEFDKAHYVEMFLWGLFDKIKPEIQKYIEK